jgi:hypothetical protein
MKYKLLLLIQNSCGLVNPIYLTHISFEPHEILVKPNVKPLIQNINQT